jgi:hypothetical protein
MPAKKKKAKAQPKKKIATKKTSKSAELFRINIEVGDVEQAAKQYSALFGQEGRPQAGSRCYFTAGAVTLQVVEVTPVHTAAKALYFLVDDLDASFERAKTLGWLSKERVHGAPGGEISVRPWGERSFYAEDAWGNPLCFVERGTVYPG